MYRWFGDIVCYLVVQPVLRALPTETMVDGLPWVSSTFLEPRERANTQWISLEILFNKARYCNVEHRIKSKPNDLSAPRVPETSLGVRKRLQIDNFFIFIICRITCRRSIFHIWIFPDTGLVSNHGDWPYLGAQTTRTQTNASILKNLENTEKCYSFTGFETPIFPVQK